MRKHFLLALVLVTLSLCAVANAKDEGGESKREKAMSLVVEGNVLLARAVEIAKNKEFFVDAMRSAIDEYDQAINTDPSVIEAHFNKGITLIWLNRCNGKLAAAAPAVDCFETVLKLKPESPEALYCIGQAYFGIVTMTFVGGSQDSACLRSRSLALEYLNKVIEKFPQSPEAELARKQIANIDYHAKTNIVKAVRENREILAIYPWKEIQRSKATEEARSKAESSTEIPQKVLGEGDTVVDVNQAWRFDYSIDDAGGRKVWTGSGSIEPVVKRQEPFGLYLEGMRVSYWYRDKESKGQIGLLVAGKEVTLADEEHFVWKITVKEYRENGSGHKVYDSMTIHFVILQK